MAIPSKEDIRKKKEALEKHLKKLDEEGKIKEGTGISMLKSSIRQVWMRAPNKLAVLEQARIPDTDPTTKTKWLFKCAICGNYFKQADIEIDHKKGNHSFKQIEDFEYYWNNILNVPTSELQVLCKETCHAIKTYMERYGGTWEEAKSMKEVINRLKQPVAKQKEELLAAGYKPAEISNKDKRRKCYEEILNEA